MQNVFCFVFFPSTFTLTAELRMNIFIIPRAPSWFTIEFRDHFAYSQELKESGEVHVVALYKKAGVACFPCTPLIPHSTGCKKCKHPETAWQHRAGDRPIFREHHSSLKKPRI